MLSLRISCGFRKIAYSVLLSQCRLFFPGFQWDALLANKLIKMHDLLVISYARSMLVASPGSWWFNSNGHDSHSFKNDLAHLDVLCGYV